jgi:hypothetical protein
LPTFTQIRARTAEGYRYERAELAREQEQQKFPWARAWASRGWHPKIRLVAANQKSFPLQIPLPSKLNDFQK